MNDSSIKTGCIITAVISIGVACYVSVKSSMTIDKYEKLIDKAADDIAMKHEDVSESIKQKAVEIAVAKTAKIVARDVSDKIENALEKEAKNQVASVVKTKLEEITKVYSSISEMMSGYITNN